MKRILRASLLLLFLLPATAFASVEITDVVYDVPGSDAGHEWVEITNKGSADADLTNFKFLEGGVKHKLTLAQGSWILAPGASAAIVTDASTFLLDHPGFSQSIYKSSFSLSNTGETIALVNASGAVEHSLSYKGTPTPPKTTSTKSSTKSSTKNSATSSKTQTAAVTNTPQPAFTTTGTSNSPLPSVYMWYAGLGAIILLGILGVLVVGPLSPKKSPETLMPQEEFELE